MDDQVEGDGHPGDSRGADKLGVAEQSSSAMVVGVKEGKWLLLED